MSNKNNDKSSRISNMLIFLAIFIIMCIHLIAVSLSLQCNKGKDIFYRFSTAIFALMFGIFYLVVNFYYLRVYRNNGENMCIICPDKIFGFF